MIYTVFNHSQITGWRFHKGVYRCFLVKCTMFMYKHLPRIFPLFPWQMSEYLVNCTNELHISSQGWLGERWCDLFWHTLRRPWKPRVVMMPTLSSLTTKLVSWQLSVFSADAWTTMAHRADDIVNACGPEQNGRHFANDVLGIGWFYASIH